MVDITKPLPPAPGTTFTGIESMKTALVTALGLCPMPGPFVSGALYVGFTIASEKGAADSALNSYNLMSAMIDSKLASYNFTGTKGELDDCKTKLGLYRTALKNWKNDKNTVKPPAILTSLRTALDGALVQYSLSMNHCSTSHPEYAAQNLMVYALCATGRLILLREAHLHGAKFGYTAQQVADYLVNLKNEIKTYTTYCNTVYNNAITTVRSNTSDDYVRFNKLTVLRNQMIQGVFDYVNSWPFLNVTMCANPPIMERVRYLFSETCGKPLAPNASLSYNKPSGYMTCDQIAASFYNTSGVPGEVFDYRMYQKEFRSFKVVAKYEDHSFIFAMPSFHDPTVPQYQYIRSSKSLGEYKNVVEQPFPNESDTHSGLEVVSDVWPGKLCFPIISQGTIGSEPIQQYSDQYALPFDFQRKSCGFAGHKIGSTFGVSVNSCNSSISALISGFMPVEVFSQNLLHSTISTSIDAQKFYNTSRMAPQHFLYDKFGIGLHGMMMKPGDKICYQLDLKDQDKTRNYALWIYGSVENITVNAPPGLILDVTTVVYNVEEKVCHITSAANTALAMIKPKMSKNIPVIVGSGVGYNRFYFKNSSMNNICLQSIVFIPK
eukprot:gene1133-1295_t